MRENSILAFDAEVSRILQEELDKLVREGDVEKFWLEDQQEWGYKMTPEGIERFDAEVQATHLGNADIN